MTRRFWMAAGLVMVAAVVVRAHAAAKPAETPEQIKVLVAQLGDADYQVRQTASDRLKAIGFPALDALNAVVESDDAEVRDRARRLVMEIRRDAVRSDAVWTYTVGQGVAGTPAVGKELVYYSDLDGSFRAVDRKTGAEKWSTPINGYSATPALLTAGQVIVVSSGRQVFCLDGQTGQVRWTFRDAAVHSPALMNETQIVVAVETGLTVLDLKTGKIAWQWQGTSAGVATMAVTKDCLVLVTGDQRLCVLDTATQALKWRYDMGDGVVSGVYVDGDVAYAATPRVMLAIDIVKKEKKWERAIDNNRVPLQGRWVTSDGRQQLPTQWLGPSWLSGNPSVVGGVLYYAAETKLYAIDPGSGQIKWTFTPSLPDPEGPQGPAATGRSRPSDRREYAIWQTVEGGLMAPVVTGKMLLVGGEGELVAVELSSGLQLWRFNTEGAVAGAPVVVDGMAYFGSTGSMRQVGRVVGLEYERGEKPGALYAVPLK